MVHAYFICAFHALISSLLVNLSIERPKLGGRWLLVCEAVGLLLLVAAAMHRFVMWGDVWLAMGVPMIAAIYYFRRQMAARLLALFLLCVPFYLSTHLHLHLISAQYSIMAMSVLCFSGVIYIFNSFSLRRSGVPFVPISIEGLRLDQERAWPVLVFCIMASLFSGFLMQPSLIGAGLLLGFVGLILLAKHLGGKMRVALLLVSVLSLWGAHGAF